MSRESEIRVNDEDKRAIKHAAAVMNMEDRPFGAVVREACNRVAEKRTIELTADDELLEALQ